MVSEQTPVKPPARGPRPDGTHGCVILFMVAVSQLVAGGSICFVLVMAWVMQTRLTEVLDEKEARLTMVPVLVRTLGVGTVIAASDIVEQQIDRSFVPKKAIRDPSVLVGRTLRERVLAGEYLREERLAELTPNQGLNAIVPAGVRAVSVDLRDGDRVSGWIEAGNAVDLLVTLRGSDGRPAETVTVAEAIRVLAVDERISETAQGEEIRTPHVTLAVPLVYAESVVHSLSIGKGKLTLRSEIDLHRQETNGATTEGELGAGSRVTVSEFRARYSEEDVSRWIEVVHGARTVREPVIDASLVRDIPVAPESNVDVSAIQ